MHRYVCGFMMNEKEVVLIHKERPREQAGKWNGIGGAVKDHELITDAMAREWEEETGDTVKHKWIEIARYQYGVKSMVHFFTAREHDMPAVMKMTDEDVDVFLIDELAQQPLVEHVEWLVHLATVHESLILPLTIKGRWSQQLEAAE